MIYLDSSVALAQLFGEGRAPDAGFWSNQLIASRLFEFEVWNRVHARSLGMALGDDVRRLCRRMEFVELVRPVLSRVLRPFPIAVRTLDAIHLSTIDFLRRDGRIVQLASYDNRILEAARAMGVPIASL